RRRAVLLSSVCGGSGFYHLLPNPRPLPSLTTTLVRQTFSTEHRFYEEAKTRSQRAGLSTRLSRRHGQPTPEIMSPCAGCHARSMAVRLARRSPRSLEWIQHGLRDSENGDALTPPSISLDNIGPLRWAFL